MPLSNFSSNNTFSPSGCSPPPSPKSTLISPPGWSVHDSMLAPPIVTAGLPFSVDKVAVYVYLYPASKPAPPFTETGHSKVLPSSTNVILTPSSVVVGKIIASAVVPSALTFISISALLSLAASVPSARLKSACVFIPEREIFNPLISGRVSSLPTAITI